MEQNFEHNFFQLLASRESCRSYDLTRPVEKAKLQKCLEAARIAPSACNSQPWRLTAVTESGLVRQMGEAIGQKFALSVPAFMAVTEIPAVLNERVGAIVGNQYFAQMDIGIVATHLCLAATAQGLSSCIIGLFKNEEELNRLLGIEQGQRLRLLIAMGYAASDKLREKQRKPLAEISSFIE